MQLLRPYIISIFYIPPPVTHFTAGLSKRKKGLAQLWTLQLYSILVRLIPVISFRPPLSANGLPDSWAFEDVPEHKRASSAPNGLASSYSKPRMDDDTDSEKETVDSDMSSAHASYMVNANEYEDSDSENEDDKTSYSTTRTTITS